MHRVIGIDLDNTLALYDRVLADMVREEGLLPPGFAPGKRAIRDALRRLPDGEMAWRRIQALLYGPRMAGADLAPGAAAFLRRARRAGARVVVVSHKTARAKAFDTGTDLRAAALEWLAAQGLLDSAGALLCPRDVFFADTREEKVRRIADLGCGLFVDDLPEVFAEPGFPAGVDRILLDPEGRPEPAGVRTCRNWKDVAAHVFGA